MAFALYKSRLAQHGAIAVNITNKNMEFSNTVAASAAANGMVTAIKLDPHRADVLQESLRLRAEIALVARNSDDMKALKLGPDWHIVHPPADGSVWTDDYSNVLSAILLKMRE